MRTLAVAVTLSLGLGMGMAAAAQEEGPYILAENSWVCVTPEAYDQAIKAAEDTNDIRALRKQFLEDKLCMTIEDEDIEDMMAPFVQVTERQEEKIKVRFEVEFYKRIAYLHRNFARITFAGWTHEDRLMPRSSLGKN